MSDIQEYPVVAFLQNCWFRPTTARHIIDSYLTDQKFRRRVLSMSMSGKRLERAFGAAFRRIWWDNASQGVGVIPSAKFPADPKHMLNVIRQVKPKAVICLGNVAADGYVSIMADAASADYQVPLPMDHEFSKTEPAGYRYAEGWTPLPWHIMKHPNAFGLTQFQLDEFAREIITRYF
jgi:hypothetical protein